MQAVVDPFANVPKAIVDLAKWMEKEEYEPLKQLIPNCAEEKRILIDHFGSIETVPLRFQHRTIQMMWCQRMRQSFVKGFYRGTLYSFSAMQYVNVVGELFDKMLDGKVFVELAPTLVEQFRRADQPNAWAAAFNPLAQWTKSTSLDMPALVFLFLIIPIHRECKAGLATFQRIVAVARKQPAFCAMRDSFLLHVLGSMQDTTLRMIEAAPPKARTEGEACVYEQFLAKWQWLWSESSGVRLTSVFDTRKNGMLHIYSLDAVADMTLLSTLEDKAEIGLAMLPLSAADHVANALIRRPSAECKREKKWLPFFLQRSTRGRLSTLIDLRSPNIKRCLNSHLIPFWYTDLLTVWIRAWRAHPLFTTSIFGTIFALLVETDRPASGTEALSAASDMSVSNPRCPTVFSAFQKLVLQHADRILLQMHDQMAVVARVAPPIPQMTLMKPLPWIHEGVPLVLPTSRRRETDEGIIETDFNDPIVYSRVFDTFNNVQALEKILACPIERLLRVAKAWAHYHPLQPRRALMVTFDTFDDFRAHKPYRNSNERTFRWMTEDALFPVYAERFRWTFSCCVPGESLVVYVNTHTVGRDRDEFEGRVFVCNAVSCVPLFNGCPVCCKIDAPGQRKWCPKCRWVSYCGAIHQRMHFRSEHKATCDQYAFLTGLPRCPATHLPDAPRIATAAALTTQSLAHASSSSTPLVSHASVYIEDIDE
jgi:hypothetical protein